MVTEAYSASLYFILQYEKTQYVPQKQYYLPFKRNIIFSNVLCDHSDYVEW